MKKEIKISTLSIVCVLCTAFVAPAFGAASVRSLGGAGTYSSASSAAAAKSNPTSGSAVSAMRAGSMRVNNASASTSATRSGSTRAATTPRLSIGKYLAGSSAVSGGSSNRVDKIEGDLSSLTGNLQDRIRILEEFMGYDATGDSIPEQFGALQVDVKQLQDDLAALTDGAVTDVVYANGVLTVTKDGVTTSYDLAAEYAGKSEVAALETKLDELQNDIPSIAGLATEQQLADLKSALEAAIDEKQDVGSYAEKSALENLATKVEGLEQGSATSSDVAALQTKVNEIALDYASKGELSEAEQSLQNAIAAIDLTPFAKTTDVNTALALKANDSDLAPVAKSGSYNDLINVPTDLVKQSALDAIETSLENAIKAGDDAAAADLAALKTQVENMSAGSTETVAGLAARVQAIEEAPYAKQSDVADALNKVDGWLASYAKTADVNAVLDAKADKTAVQSAVDTITSSLQGVSGLVQSNAEDIADNANAILGIQTSVSSLSSDMTDAKQSISDLKTADSEMAEKIQTNADDIATNLGYITSNSGEIDAISGAIEGINEELDELANVARTGDYADLINKPDMTQYVTNETLEQNYVTNQTLENKKYLTEENAANTYLTATDAEQTYMTAQQVTEQVTEQVNKYEIPDNSITAAKIQQGAVTEDKLQDGAVTARKINSGSGNGGEMLMLMSNGNGTSEWVSVSVY